MRLPRFSDPPTTDTSPESQSHPPCQLTQSNSQNFLPPHRAGSALASGSRDCRRYCTAHAAADKTRPQRKNLVLRRHIRQTGTRSPRISGCPSRVQRVHIVTPSLPSGSPAIPASQPRPATPKIVVQAPLPTSVLQQPLGPVHGAACPWIVLNIF